MPELRKKSVQSDIVFTKKKKKRLKNVTHDVKKINGANFILNIYVLLM